MTSRNPLSMSRLNRTVRLAGVTALAAAIMLPACGRKEEPPPPPPPPPPPVVIPDPVDMEALRQNLGVDARVQIARSATTTERDFGEAAILFADAWARGDASTLREMFSRGDRAVLDELRATGDWDAEVEKIEQVRIVYLSEHGVDMQATPGELGPAQLALMEERARELGMQAGLQAAFQMSPEQLQLLLAGGPEAEQVMEQFLRDSPQGAELLEELQSLAEGGVSIREPVVTLALQQPDGAYVLAWSARNAGGRWTFESLHSIDRVRPRASQWDGSPGLAGAMAADVEDDADPTGPASPDAPQPDQEEDERTPGQIRTPAGPLTVPGSS